MFQVKKNDTKGTIKKIKLLTKFPKILKLQTTMSWIRFTG